MAGQARRDTRGHGRSSQGGRSWPVVAVASAAAYGSTTDTRQSGSDLATLTPDTETRATYRNLLLRGLAPDEAANLTAYLCGIQLAETAWTIREVNRILFLRELNRTGRFGELDGHPASEPN
jgi:hypothetical protein